MINMTSSGLRSKNASRKTVEFKKGRHQIKKNEGYRDGPLKKAPFFRTNGSYIYLISDTINKALLLRTRYLVLDSELQFGPSSREQPEGTEYRALHLRSTEKTFKTKRNGASARIKIYVLHSS